MSVKNEKYDNMKDFCYFIRNLTRIIIIDNVLLALKSSLLGQNVCYLSNNPLKGQNVLLE